MEIGDRVDTSTVITTLDDRSVLLVDFTVPESFIGRIVTDLEVQARQWESPDDNTSGRIVAVDSRVDSATRALEHERLSTIAPTASDRAWRSKLMRRSRKVST